MRLDRTLCTLSALVVLSAALPVAAQVQGSGLRATSAQQGQAVRQVTDARPYQALSATERAQLHDQYERMDAGDEPPYPLAGMAPLMDGMSRAQSKVPVRGWLRLVADVNASGKVVNVAAYGTAPKPMAEFGAKLLAMTAFKPAVCKGRPCAMQFPLELDFATE
ncbi:MAG: hypothetical protein ACKVQR_16400 [Aquabacterium sp.]